MLYLQHFLKSLWQLASIGLLCGCGRQPLKFVLVNQQQTLVRLVVYRMAVLIKLKLGDRVRGGLLTREQNLSLSLSWAANFHDLKLFKSFSNAFILPELKFRWPDTTTTNNLFYSLKVYLDTWTR